MREEIKQALELKNNPYADQRTFRDLQEKLSWYNLATMDEEEKEAMRIIFKS